MMRDIMIVLAMLLLVFVLLRTILRRRRAPQNGLQTLWDSLEAEREQFKNQRSNIPLPFLTLDLSLLPVQDYSAASIESMPKSARHQADVLAQAEAQMIRFDVAHTNAALKEIYGEAQLDNIARFEENFSRLIHMMAGWAIALQKEGQNEDAAKVLQAAVTYGSDYSKTYIMLADLYDKCGDRQALSALSVQAAAANLQLREKVVQHIDQYLCQR